MRFLSVLAVTICSLRTAFTQTFTPCNPLYELCDPAPALGRTISIEFDREGPSGAFVRTGSPTIVYDRRDGAKFSISSTGHNPTLQSKFYIMFGKVSVVARAAHGAGIVSSIVLQSDDLDEIDFELVGNDPRRVQTNYFSKGDTTTYDRGRYHDVPGARAVDEFHTYTVEWTADHIKWFVDNHLLRVLHSAERPDIYPQTPMSLRIGSWVAGDPASNNEGTIQWAGGEVDYAQGPFIYDVKEISVEDYSTGTSYEYTDHSGSWQSIKATNGNIGSSGPVSKKWFHKFINIARPL